MASHYQNPKDLEPTTRVVRDALPTVTATEAKRRFGLLLEGAIQGRTVVITRRKTAKAVLLPIAEYKALWARRMPEIPELTAEFDAWLDSLQTPEHREAMTRAFNLSPKEMGLAAVEYHRRRG